MKTSLLAICMASVCLGPPDSRLEYPMWLGRLRSLRLRVAKVESTNSSCGQYSTRRGLGCRYAMPYRVNLLPGRGPVGAVRPAVASGAMISAIIFVTLATFPGVISRSLSSLAGRVKSCPLSSSSSIMLLLLLPLLLL